MSKKDNNIASQAILDMDKIMSTIKEESKKTMKGLLGEAVRDALREECSEEEEKDYEVIDAEKEDKNGSEEKSEKMDSEVEDGEAPETEGEDAQPAEEEQPQEAPQEGEGEDEWDKYSQYQVDNNTYDLTGENDYENVVKVYKLLKPEDNVIVQKDGNTLQIQDKDNDTEYVIDLGGEEEAPEENKGEEAIPSEVNESADEPAGFNDEEDAQVEPEDETAKKSDDELEPETDEEENNLDDTMMENKKKQEVLFEVDLGYTDNYQDKDVIPGLSNEEPSKTGRSWHKGVPTGTEKPWAGPSEKEGNPFDKSVDECGDIAAPVIDEEDMVGAVEEEPVEEQYNVGGFVQQNSVTTSVVPNSDGRDARSRRGSKGFKPSTEPRYSTNESKEMKLVKKENKELKDVVNALRKNLNEAYITNVNLGKITKLFLENTTSQAEKISIVNRFVNEAKTVEQSKNLYESINKELKKSSKSISINESSVTAKGTKELNEGKAYQSSELLKTIDLMNRMNNL